MPSQERTRGGIVVIGGANMDITACSDEPLRRGDSTRGRIEQRPGGVARNIAEWLARLAPRRAVRLISAVGQDAAGHELLRATAAAGVDVGGCLALRGQCTASYCSMHAADGTLLAAIHQMQVLDALTPARLAPEAAALRQARAIVIDANLSSAALAWVFEQAGSAPVFADPVSTTKCQRLLPWLARIHTLKPNAQEAQALGAGRVRSAPEAERAAMRLHALGVQQVGLSLGVQGLLLSAPRHGAAQSVRQEALQAASAAAINGAGDALLAGLIHATLARWPLPRRAAFAAACAALKLDAEHPPSLRRAQQRARSQP